MFDHRALIVPALLVLGSQTLGAESGPQSPYHGHGTPAKPTRADLVSTLPDITKPVQQVTLSAPLRGVLKQVLVVEGNRVERGQILAVMDNRVASAEVRLATAMSARTAAIKEAECQLEIAENLLSRLLQVQDHNAVSELEIDQARSSRDQAKAALARAHEQADEARINLQLAQAKLETYNIRAPFAGLVLRVEAHAGETLTDADAVAILANPKDLRAELYVPLEWYGQLTVGTKYQLQASAPVNRPIPATLVAFEPVVDAATGTFRCVFDINNATDQLPAGFSVRLIRPTTLEDTRRAARRSAAQRSAGKKSLVTKHLATAGTP